jgi:N-acetylglucosamine kinase-like BadF-type ATPase
MPQLIAGFDAGQTHTRCRLALVQAAGSSTGLEPLAEGSGSGVSHLAAADGPARFQAALTSSLAAARAQLSESEYNLSPLAAAAVGASGVEQGSELQGRGQALAAAALGLAPAMVAVTGDERTALAGAFGAGAGVLVISGTGAIAVGRDGAGHSHRCGGWGWLLDGAGSAMDIGRDGLAASVAMADGRRAETQLRSALWQTLGAGSAQAVKAAVVASDFGAAGFAQLAPVVDRLAGAGDPEAIVIMRRSATALAELVVGVATALAMPATPVCPVGGALTHLRQLRRHFEQSLQLSLPGASLVSPIGDACSGALALAAALLD